MSDKLQAALVDYLKSKDKAVDPEEAIGCELYISSSCGCCDPSDPTLDLEYKKPGQRYVYTYEVENHDLTDFLTFIVEHTSE